MRSKATDSRGARRHRHERARGGVSYAPQRQYQDSDWKRELIKSIARELEAQLAFFTMRRDVGYVGIEQICKATSASREQFETWCMQVRTLADQIIACSIELDEEGIPDETIDTERAKLTAELLEGVSLPSPPDPIVDYKFADLIPDQAFQAASNILRNECVQFASAFMSSMESLQNRLVVGSTEHTRTSCKAEFYRHRITFQALETQLRSYPSRTSNSNAANRVDIFREQGLKVATSTISHVHHVHHPVRREVGSEKYPIPVQFIPILDSIPSWLAPNIQILEGTQINEIRREERTSEHTHLKRQYVSSKWQLEPAILFGNFVLAGWNEREIEVEERRRRQSANGDRIRKQASRSKAWLAGAGALGAASIACMAGSAKYQSLAIAALLLGTGAVYATSRNSRQAEQSKYVVNLSINAIITFASLALVYGFTNGSIATIVLGTIGVAATAFALWGHKVVEAVREEFGE